MFSMSRSGNHREAQDTSVGGLPQNVPLFDADGALSREYLLRRGYCCQHGCKNCPYGFGKSAPNADGNVDPNTPEA